MMMEKQFGKWLKKKLNEYADFGFEQESQNDKKKGDPEGDLPLDPVNLNHITKLLTRKAYGVKFPIINNFFGEVQWGNSDGALQVKFSPLGGLNASIRKMIHTLKGEKVWICKKVVEIKHIFDEYPDKLHFALDEVLTETDNTGLDAPSADYKDLERLTVQLAATLRGKTTQRIFIYEGIRVLKEGERYIIHFGVTGMGRQRPGQKRLDQFAVDVGYNREDGIIKIAGNELGDKIDKYRWIYDPSNFIENFTPSQNIDEIKNAILVHFNCY
jgi:hypothetical protein